MFRKFFELLTAYAISEVVNRFTYEAINKFGNHTKVSRNRLRIFLSRRIGGGTRIQTITIPDFTYGSSLTSIFFNPIRINNRFLHIRNIHVYAIKVKWKNQVVLPDWNSCVITIYLRVLLIVHYDNGTMWIHIILIQQLLWKYIGVKYQ